MNILQLSEFLSLSCMCLKITVFANFSKIYYPLVLLVVSWLVSRARNLEVVGSSPKRDENLGGVRMVVTVTLKYTQIYDNQRTIPDFTTTFRGLRPENLVLYAIPICRYFLLSVM